MFEEKVNQQLSVIRKGTLEIIEETALRGLIGDSITNNQPLTIKLGLDPTAPDIHLGHGVVLRKIRQLQELGHKAIIIIGDFTGMIGDPTGRSKTRNQLTKEMVLSNAKTYTNQLFKILLEDKTEVLFNSDWLLQLNFNDIIELTSKHTIARILEREDFKNRFSNKQPIGIHELFYPIMQGYDSVHIKADIELGGTEQRFNILLGRAMQEQAGQKPQLAIFMPLLEGIDGVEKMSKSLGNYIGIEESPSEMYNKVMRIDDGLIIRYFTLCTDMSSEEIQLFQKELDNNIVNPRDMKMVLACEIVTLYHGKSAAEKAEKAFIRTFHNRKVPKELDIIKVYEPVEFLDIIIKTNVVASKSEARRLIKQGGIGINQKKIAQEDFQVESGDVLNIGKQHFFKIEFD